MTDDERTSQRGKSGFWTFFTTLPGLLTAIAGLITAVVAAVVALKTLNTGPTGPDPLDTRRPHETAVAATPTTVTNPGVSQVLVTSAPHRMGTLSMQDGDWAGLLKGMVSDAPSGDTLDVRLILDLSTRKLRLQKVDKGGFAAISGEVSELTCAAALQARIDTQVELDASSAGIWICFQGRNFITAIRPDAVTVLDGKLELTYVLWT